MTRRVWVVLLLVLGLLAAGIALYSWPEPALSPAVARTPSCVDDPEISAAVQSGATLDIAPRPEWGSAPAGFATTSVLVCEVAPGAAPGDFNPDIRQVTYFGDGIDAVTDAFDARSYKLKLSILGSCSGDYLNPPVVWLVDDSGLGYRPQFPKDHCGRPSDEPLDLINRLTVQDDRIVPAPLAN
ncbi:hypothetical protein CH275_16705 [Rhodococcus sp. 06-235-1A]|uniref:hypothetical protein n=1 Tax=Rhodococcus sp. 06-235-1A TaxID=2022508 RepID=UPI000B9B569F|nr:hypothetical protein [Rhodococcus sp. 06-235-1A]OZD03411.1 hypothetical protein CH275_16705 [Rhodococcus sp. 06-235-1A]